MGEWEQQMMARAKSTFREQFLGTRQARIYMACYGIIFAAILVVALVSGLALKIIAISLPLLISMFFGTYVVNCYVVGSCHALSWATTIIMIIYTAVFCLRLLAALLKK